MEHDIVLTRRDGSVRNFRIYDRLRPTDGDIITLPVDGQLIKARVTAPLEGSKIAQSVAAEAAEV